MHYMITGGNGQDVDTSTSSDLVAASSYLDMLADDRRNLVYHKAIKAVVKPGNTVLDIGRSNDK